MGLFQTLFLPLTTVCPHGMSLKFSSHEFAYLMADKHESGTHSRETG